MKFAKTWPDSPTSMLDHDDLADLPGSELVLQGMTDLAEARFDTVEALLVAIGSPRLKRLGFDLPYSFPDLPEHDLYHHLAAIHGDSAHSKYGALIRRLVSFERALAGRVWRNRVEPKIGSSNP